MIKILLTLLLLTSPALAQSVSQSGSVTPGHAARWVSNGVIGDAGTAASGSLTSLGVTNNGGAGVCVNSAATTGPYNQICLAATTSGGSKISSYAYGGATTPGITFDINGTVQGFPTVTLPVSIGDVACFSSTTGTIATCGSPLLPLTNGSWYVGNASNIATATLPSVALDQAFGSTQGFFLARGASTWSGRTIAGSDLPNPSTTTLGGVFSLPVTSNSVLSGIGNDGTPTRATTTGTGDVVRATSPTISTSLSVTGTETITSSSALALAVGRLGIVTPALTVDASAANSITGLSIAAQSTGNGVNLTAIGETNVPLIINGAGSGTINFGTTSTGTISFFRQTNFMVGGFNIFGATSGFTNVIATAIASGTLTLPAATDTLVGKATTDTFTNKTFDTAGTGNSLSINGVAVTANTGTGAVARADSPTFTTLVSLPRSIVTAQSTTALAVGRLGATTPALQVDSNTASSITGLKVTAAASGGGLALAAVGETNVNTTIDSAGSGTLILQGTGTGAITLSRATGVTGALTITSSSASSLAVGRLGATTPAFVVDSSVASHVNGVQILPAATGGSPTISTVGSDTNIAYGFSSKGSGSIIFYTQAGGSIQFQVLDSGVVNNRWITLVGSNGGNPTITTIGGDVAFGASISATTTDATSTTTGAIKNTGGMSVNKRVFMNGLSADTGMTDNSVCHNTTTHEIATGTGAAGICLGTSSRRYKRDIITARVGLDEIMRLRPVNFHYLPGYGGQQLQYGFVAEEVVDVIPTVVGLDPEGRPNSVDMVAMIPILVNAIQDLRRDYASQRRARR